MQSTNFTASFEEREELSLSFREKRNRSMEVRILVNGAKKQQYQTYEDQVS